MPEQEDATPSARAAIRSVEEDQNAGDRHHGDVSPTSLLEGRDGPSVQEWRAVKEEIRVLYQSKPLKEVKRLMEQRHGFRATERMYKARLASWGFSKNYSDHDYQICAVLHYIRQNSGKQATAFEIHGRKRSLKDLHKYIKGKKMSEEEFLATALKTTHFRSQEEQERDPQYAHVRSLTPEVDVEFEEGLDIKGQKCTDGAFPNPRHTASWPGVTTPTSVTEQTWPLSTPNNGRPDLVGSETRKAAVSKTQPGKETPASPHPTKHLQKFVRPYLPLKIRGRSELAFADTSAQANAMSEAFARELNLTIDKSGATSFHCHTAVRKRMNAIGHTTVRCSLPLGVDKSSGHQSVPETKFWVYPKLVEPLVVGNSFLQSTGILASFKERVRQISVPIGSALRVCHMELPRRRINCTVNDERVLANPDTGSDVDLISLDYVQRSGLEIQPLESAYQYVEFADTSQKILSGSVLVSFRFGSRNANDTDELLRRFYILDELTTDVLIGNNTLDDFDAFNTYRGELVDLEEYDGSTDFHLIRWVQKSGAADFLDQNFQDFEFSTILAASAPMQEPQKSILSRLLKMRSTRRNSKNSSAMTADESRIRSERYLKYRDLKEDHRRRLESARIAKLPSLTSHEKALAEVAEAAMRDRYDRERSDFVIRHIAALQLAAGVAIS
ncbi:hypothetical protein LTR84_011549 [Exophiala bonariae]|uniref:Clr5 domain-containing protein n=1 Tax=Exophiala bonariae TaxID=1690606 RepID=A0AAV9NJY6_9EURO|nr:hypothetical protein LTR84_011549 [Exophiala bonariae]